MRDPNPPSRTKPISILVAALGGEGGGVLCEWLVDAATRAGYPVQGTSIPGVAQRTGATTYYVEISPLGAEELGARRPIFSLTPVPGTVDLVIASELLEAARVLGAGMVDPVHTTLISSHRRTLTTTEKMALADGRLDVERLLHAAREFSARCIAFDMQAEAQAAKTVVSAVMFGAIAGSGKLPFARVHCEAAIEASGKGVRASLAGFARGFAASEDALSRDSTPRDQAEARPGRPAHYKTPRTGRPRSLHVFCSPLSASPRRRGQSWFPRSSVSSTTRTRLTRAFSCNAWICWTRWHGGPVPTQLNGFPCCVRADAFSPFGWRLTMSCGSRT